MSNAAEWPADIDLARAQAARNRAQATLADPAATDKQRELARHAVRRADARFAVHRSYEAYRDPIPGTPPPGDSDT